jgi:hypothetical protein
MIVLSGHMPSSMPAGRRLISSSSVRKVSHGRLLTVEIWLIPPGHPHSLSRKLVAHGGFRYISDVSVRKGVQPGVLPRWLIAHDTWCRTHLLFGCGHPFGMVGSRQQPFVARAAAMN